MKDRDCPPIPRRLWLGPLILWVTGCTAVADSWGPPANEHWSRNHQYVLRVEWPRGGLSLWHETEALKERIWTRGYVDAWPPNQAFVGDHGRYVVQVDQHHNLGLGPVIAILGPSGKLTASYELKDFLSEEEIGRATRSVSSIWWKNYAWLGFLNEDTQFAVVTEHGTVRCFDLATGKLDMTEALAEQIRGSVVADANNWITITNAHARISGIILLSALGEERAIPAAKEFLKDQTETARTGSSQGRPWASIFGVQIAGARALLQLMGADAIPIIESEMTSSNWRMQEEFLKTLTELEKPGGRDPDPGYRKALNELWQRSLQSPSSEIRDHARLQILIHDGSGYLYSHPELMEDDNRAIRSQALGVLIQDPTPRAVPLLRQALADTNLNTQRMVLKELTKRDMADLQPVFLQFLDHQDLSIRTHALIGLVRLRHPTGMALLQDRLRAWKNHSHSTIKAGQIREAEQIHGEAPGLCFCIAGMKLQAMKPLLEEVWIESCPDLEEYLLGTLAVLGEKAALSRLHDLVAEGKMGVPFITLRMLALVGDPVSIRLISEAVDSKLITESKAAQAAWALYESRQSNDPSHQPKE